VHDDQLFGQRDAVLLVREFMERPVAHGRPCGNRSPVVVFDGPHGAGKTALLDSLAGRLAKTVPFARYDFESDPYATVDDVLTVLAFELARWRPVYGSLEFHRFAIGQLIKRQRFDLDRKKARQQAINVLAGYRHLDTLRDVLAEATAEVLGRVSAPVPLPTRTVGKYGAQFLFDRLTSWVRGRRMLLGRYQHWYGTQEDSVEALVDLNRWARGTDDGSRKKVAELMWAAFLADVQDAYQHGRRSGEWSLNSVLLLDNVDTELGRSFLAELTRARASAQAAGQGADPLTVVATSRGALRADGRPTSRVVLGPTDTDYAGYVERHPKTPMPLWLISGLPRLTVTDVDVMVRRLRLADGDTHLLATRVHAVTEGHPASTRLLLAAVAERGTAEVELADVLAWPPPDELKPSEATVAAEIGARLLTGVPDDDVENLVTIAAARGKNQALVLAARSNLLGDHHRTQSMFEHDLWATGSGGTQPLRRLLLRRLAARPADHPADWSTVHGSLRRFCRDAQDKDEAGEMYHALADEDVLFVVSRLNERLTEQDTADWLRLLVDVTSAPRKTDRSPTQDQVKRLTDAVRAADEKLYPLAKVVVGKWIVADPTTEGNQRRLHFGIATAYNDIAAFARSPALIEDEAYQHNEAAKLWR